MNRHVPHSLKCGIAQRHSRRHCYAVACMDPHRIKVFNRAYDRDIVIGVAQQLQLILFPPHDRFIDHNLVDRAQMQAACQRSVKLFRIVNNGRTTSSERIRRPNAQRESKLLCRFFSFEETFCRSLGSHWDLQLLHELPELLPILRDFNRGDIHSNHLHAILFPQPHLIALNAQVKSRLSSHGRQNRVNGMLL